jgi:hypothetical protein
MIESVVETVASELNEYFRLKFGITENRAVAANLVNQDGTLAIKDDNRVIISLVMIQEEKLGTNKNNGRMSPGSTKPVHLNLYLLFSASFNEKLNIDALKFLSAVIAFFQNKPLFTSDNSPGLPDGLEKLSFEISNMNVQEQSNLWSFIGAKYIPSILYKARVVPIDEETFKPEKVQITGRDLDTRSE